MDSKNRLVITKENLISMIADKSRDDYISSEDLFDLINKATDEDGIISKKRLMKSIKGYHTKSVIKDVYGLLEDVIFSSLSSVDDKQDVCIRLFEGVSIDGVYIPEKTKMINFTGEMHTVGSKIKPKFNITRSYCEKLNNN